MRTSFQDGHAWPILPLAAVAGLVAASAAAIPAAAQPAAGRPAPSGAPAPTGPAPTVRLAPGDDLTLDDVQVVARRLDEARLSIQPSLGATRTDFGRAAIEAIPQGDNAALNQVLLRAPGVVQDAFGNVFIRGDHRNVQYRINGVQLPEGLAGFASTLQARFANNVSLLTGALPAQYGFRTAGVVDIQTKTGINSPGTTVSLYGGSRGTVQPSFEYGGRSGPVDYFFTGEYLRSNIGIENPTSRFNARNDETNQARGFAYVSGILDDTTRLTLMTGTAYGDFRVPTRGGLPPTLGLTVNGVSDFDSSILRQRQRQFQQFGILSLQKHTDNADVQTSVFTRYDSLRYSPDPLGDLLYNGQAQAARREITSTGVQTDASWRVSDTHTLRGGFLAQIERTSSRATTSVLPMDDAGVQTADQPLTIGDKTARTGAFYGVYLQDEWRILPRVTLNYGARGDIVDEYTHEAQISPRVNVVWKPLDGTTLHAGYARYFNPPPFELVGNTTISRFLGTTAQPAVLQSSPVKAERSHYFDAGIQQVVIPGLTLGVDGFYKRATNLIDEGQFGSPILLTAFNYARGDVTGVEFSGTYERGPLSLFGNLTISRAIGRGIVSSQFNFSQADLDYISQHYIKQDHDQRFTGSAGAAYTLMQGQATPLRVSADLLVGSGLRASASDIPNGRALGGYYTVNLSAVQKLDPAVLGGRGRGTELRLDVINLLDRKYLLRDGSGLGVGNPQYGLRRAILAGVSQRF
jgi:outer membrane receptor protein involved in Fe transport